MSDNSPDLVKDGPSPHDRIEMVAFLEDAPPSDEMTLVANLATNHQGRDVINVPPIELYCPTKPACDGKRTFRYHEGHRFVSSIERTKTFITYLCSNCRKTLKTFSLLIIPDEKESFPAALCAKFGEVPKFGSPTSKRLLRLFGSDSKVFLKGRQCENQGLGIGAFSYYRRVVESHKDQLFDEIIKVASKIAPETLEALRSAKEQHQFLNALESVRSAFPQGLLINGHNPLLLLHSALSDGLHARTDEECLQSAQDIRIVLSELVERMAQALKDEAGLAAAVARLTTKRS